MGSKSRSSDVKTNAMRKLDTAGIHYETKAYPVADEHLSADQVAALVGLEPRRVFKTLLCRGSEGELLFAVVPANAELDLKALARASALRKVSLVPLKEVTSLTGYIRGGVTAIAAKKTLPVMLDESAQEWPSIAVSAGIKGLQIIVAPKDYVQITQARCASISTPRDEATGAGSETV